MSVACAQASNGVVFKRLDVPLCYIFLVVIRFDELHLALLLFKIHLDYFHCNVVNYIIDWLESSFVQISDVLFTRLNCCFIFNFFHRCCKYGGSGLLIQYKNSSATFHVSKLHV